MEQILISEPFLIVVSGVLIFTAQKLISELWIAPLLKLNEIRAKIETLIFQYAYLSSVSLGVSEKLDKEIYFFKDELRSLAGDLLATFNNVPWLEKIWLKKVSGIDILEVIGPLTGLSNTISTPSDATRPKPYSYEFTNLIKKHLKLIIK